MRKRLVALLGVAVIVLAACSPAASNPPAASGGTASGGPGPSTGGGGLAENQVLRLYLSAEDPATLDPALAQDAVSIAILQNTARGLLGFNKDLQVVPVAAEALPQVTDGGKTLTFKIKQGAVFSDGTQIVAEDFVRQFKALLDPRGASPYAYIACDLVGAMELLGSNSVGGQCPGEGGAPPAATDNAKIDNLLTKIGVSAPDATTVVVKLARPATYFSTIMAMWVAVPRSAKETKFTEAADLNSSGPFQVDSWSHNSLIKLVPNPKWYGDVKPTLTSVELNIGGDPAAALAAFETGDLDMVTVPSTDVQRVHDDAKLSPMILDTAQLQITYYDYNDCQTGDKKCPNETGPANGKSATQNKNFRIALTQAVDKQAFVNFTFGGLGQVANSMVMPGIPGYDADYNPYPYDVKSAKDHLKTAITELGVTDTNADKVVDIKDLGPMKFGYNCNAGHLPRVAFLAEAWRTGLGINTEGQLDISCTDFPTLLQERPAGKYSIARDGWNADFPHAKNQLDLLSCGNGNNSSQYCNPAFDKAFLEAATIADPAQQAAKYIEAQRIAVDDAPVLFLRFGLTRYLIQPYVKGVQATVSDSENVGDRFFETISIASH